MILYYKKIPSGYSLYFDAEKTEHAGFIDFNEGKLFLSLVDCLDKDECEKECAVVEDDRRELQA